MPPGYAALKHVGRRLLDAADVQDELCARLADCSSCTRATQAPQQGQLTAVRCQWVFGASGPSCIGWPSGSGTSEFSTWLSRHERLAISESEFGSPRPKCRLIVRDSSKCITQSALRQLAQKCDAVPSPRCHTCGYLVPECGFCGEASVNAAAAMGRVVATRCIARFEADTTPCTVACDSQEEVFQITTASDDGGTVLRGLVEFPLWRGYGMQYAASQSCTWRLGEPSLGPVTSVLQQALERYDAIHIKDADWLTGELPIIFGKDQAARTELQLAAPLTLQFFSDNTREASGFVFSWDQTPASNGSAGSPPPSGSPSSGWGGGGSLSRDGFLQQNLVYILVGSVGVVFAVIMGCVCLICARRLTYWMGVGSNVPTASTPRSRREEREGRRQEKGEEEDIEDIEGRRRQEAYQENLQRRREAKAAAGDASHEPSPGQPRAGASYRGKPKAKAATRVRQQASTTSASGGKAGEQQPAPPKAPPPTPKPPKSPFKSENELKAPEEPGDATSSAAAVHKAAIHQEMLQAMNAPSSERKAILRELQRKWHPDKNKEDDKEVATAVFQYINANSQWFLTNTGEMPSES